jgi:hypothetical protein
MAVILLLPTLRSPAGIVKV